MGNIKTMLKKMIVRILGTKWVYRFISFFLPFRCHISAGQARDTLQTYSPAPACKTALTVEPNQLSDPPQVDLQIVIPCYNCERYLEKCMASVLGQKTRFTYYVFLIDDGSKDGTADLLDKKYAGLDCVTVIHKENGGAASARNIGLTKLIGKYVMFVDADDTLPDGAIESLLTSAFSNDADVVQGSYETVFANGERTNAERKNGVIDARLLNGFPCGKVYRASLWETIVYPEGYWFEDTMNHLLLHRHNLICYAVPETVYSYFQNSSSCTAIAVHHKRSVETYWVTELLLADMKKIGMPFDQECLEKILWQFVTNINRCLFLPSKIRKAIFILQCDLLRQYFPQTDVNESFPINVLLERRYWRFYWFCLFQKCNGKMYSMRKSERR